MFPRILAIIMLFGMFGWIQYTSYTSEHFLVAANADIPQVNKDDNPWNRHPISSVPIDYDVRYKTMYMAEYDNVVYEQKLKHVFGIPSPKQEEIRNISQWTILDVDNKYHKSYIVVAYEKLIEYISTTLRTSDELDLPYDNPYNRPVVQVVHDVLLQFKRHVDNYYKYAVSLELILYRENKFHGKHVSMEAIIDYDKKKNTWLFDIIEVKILGIVSEDGIGLFPVVPYHQDHVDAVNWTDTVPMILPSNDDVIEVIRRQNKLQIDNLSAQSAITM